MLDLNHILTLLRQALPSKGQSIPLHEPIFTGNEWNYVKECLDTGWVSSVGQFVDRFEKELAAFTGARYAIATANGTAAVHMSYILAGVRAGDEVLVPTLTFVGTTNPVAYCHAIPHFIDSDADTLGIDPKRLDSYLEEMTEIKQEVCFNRQTQRPIRALCVMHTLGHPADMDPLIAICKKFHLILLEDAAEALGSYYKGVHVGHLGRLGALSFNGNKIMTTGGGGAVLTNDADLAKQAKHLTTTAKLPHAWAFEHNQVGYNYRLPNINAALGCAQLEKMHEFLANKRKLAHHYQETFKHQPGIRFIKEPVYANSNYWLNAFLLDNAECRNSLLDLLNQNGIMARPLWNLQHTLPMYRDCPRMPLFVAEDLVTRLIKVPSSVHLI